MSSEQKSSQRSSYAAAAAKPKSTSKNNIQSATSHRVAASNFKNSINTDEIPFPALVPSSANGASKEQTSPRPPPGPLPPRRWEVLPLKVQKQAPPCSPSDLKSPTPANEEPSTSHVVPVIEPELPATAHPQIDAGAAIPSQIQLEVTTSQDTSRSPSMCSPSEHKTYASVLTTPKSLERSPGQTEEPETCDNIRTGEIPRTLDDGDKSFHKTDQDCGEVQNGSTPPTIEIPSPDVEDSEESGEIVASQQELLLQPVYENNSRNIESPNPQPQIPAQYCGVPVNYVPSPMQPVPQQFNQRFMVPRPSPEFNPMNNTFYQSAPPVIYAPPQYLPQMPFPPQGSPGFCSQPIFYGDMQVPQFVPQYFNYQAVMPMHQGYFAGYNPYPQTQPQMGYSSPNCEQPRRSTECWNKALASMERENRIREKIGLIIDTRYTILQKISGGSYGCVFAALDRTTDDRVVAVKFETYKNEHDESHIGHEYEVYKKCSTVGTEDPAHRRAVGFPMVYWTGIEFNYRIMVMELLGPSLENLFGFCGRYFSAETIYKLGCQMIDRIAHLHRNGFVHRDLKPDNFLMGIHNFETTLFLVDFGLTRQLRTGDPSEEELRKAKSLVGTAKYASINSHKGIELSRRDDLESLGYILLEFMVGDLPWKIDDSKQRRREYKQEAYKRMQRGKEETQWENVCPALQEWMTYVKNMKFNEEPNYERLRGYLRLYVENSPVQNAADQMAAVNFYDGRYNQRRLRGKRSNAQVVPAFSSSSTGSNSGGGGDGMGSMRLEDRLMNCKYEWLQRRDNHPNERYTYECLYKWTLPYGTEPQRPMNHISSNKFGYAPGEGGFA